MKPPIHFRHVEGTDRDFLYRLFVSTRLDITMANLAEAEKKRLLDLQFTAQSRDYAARYPDAEFLVILSQGRPVGRLSRHMQPDAIHIIDIALLPEFRNTGIGNRVVMDLQTEARLLGRCVRIYVETFNRAMRFYQRLGFVTIGELELHHLMEWNPARAASESALVVTGASA